MKKALNKIALLIFTLFVFKQLSPLGEGWDGTYNGELLPATDYWFKITLDVTFGNDETNIKTYTGHFSLKR